MTQFSSWLPAAAALLLLTGCGGGGSSSDSTAPVEPAPALAADLSSIEVRNATGDMLVRHEFVTDSANQESVYSAQNAGTDGLWGTTDDVRTVHLTCSYTGGAAMDKRLLEGGWFDWGQLTGAGPALCQLRRPVAGTIGVSKIGGLQSVDGLNVVHSYMANPTGQIILSLFSSATGISQTGERIQVITLGSSQPQRFSLESRPDGSLRFCNPDCTLSLAYDPNHPSSTNLNATGLDNIVYNPYAGLTHSVYRGIHYLPHYENGRLDILAYTSDVEQPSGHEDSYDQVRYHADGTLSRIEHFQGIGTDSRWYTNDDVMSDYLTQEKTLNGWQRVHYNDKGADAIWSTADDQIASTLTVIRTAAGQVSEVRSCSAAGPDTIWQTPDDVCQTATLHYAANLARQVSGVGIL